MRKTWSGKLKFDRDYGAYCKYVSDDEDKRKKIVNGVYFLKDRLDSDPPRESGSSAHVRRSSSSGALLTGVFARYPGTRWESPTTSTNSRVLLYAESSNGCSGKDACSTKQRGG